MLRTWTRSIGWTVLLSAALAVLFAMVCDGCSGAVVSISASAVSMAQHSAVSSRKTQLRIPSRFCNEAEQHEKRTTACEFMLTCLKSSLTFPQIALPIPASFSPA